MTKKIGPRRARKIAKAWKTLTDVSFLKRMRDTMLKRPGGKAGCIVSARLVCVLARLWGIPAQVVTVETTIMNPILAPAVLASARGPRLGIPRQEQRRLMREGAWVVVLGPQSESDLPGMWHGHLVTVVHGPGGQRAAIDLTIDQAHRPDRNIFIVGDVILVSNDDYRKMREEDR